MNDDRNPGDLSVRISFGRVYGSGPDSGALRPTIEITDGTSRKTLTIEITPTQLADMLSGSAAEVPADKVNGFSGVKDWGKFHKVVMKTVDAMPGDYALKNDPPDHVQNVVETIEADGFRVDKPSLARNVWRIIGRRYDDKP